MQAFLLSLYFQFTFDEPLGLVFCICVNADICYNEAKKGRNKDQKVRQWNAVTFNNTDLELIINFLLKLNKV